MCWSSGYEISIGSTPEEEVSNVDREYYSDHYKPGRAFNKICDIKQTGTGQNDLHDIDRLNGYAKMPS